MGDVIKFPGCYRPAYWIRVKQALGRIVLFVGRLKRKIHAAEVDRWDMRTEPASLVTPLIHRYTGPSPVTGNAGPCSRAGCVFIVPELRMREISDIVLRCGSVTYSLWIPVYSAMSTSCTVCRPNQFSMCL